MQVLIQQIDRYQTAIYEPIICIVDDIVLPLTKDAIVKLMKTHFDEEFEVYGKLKVSDNVAFVWGEETDIQLIVIK